MESNLASLILPISLPLFFSIRETQSVLSFYCNVRVRVRERAFQVEKNPVVVVTLGDCSDFSCMILTRPYLFCKILCFAVHARVRMHTNNYTCTSTVFLLFLCLCVLYLLVLSIASFVLLMCKVACGIIKT